MVFISFSFYPFLSKIRSFDRSRYRQFKKPKFRKTEITTTRNPDNSNTRKLELSGFRRKKNGKTLPSGSIFPFFIFHFSFLTWLLPVIQDALSYQ